MTNKKFIQICTEAVVDYFNDHKDKTDQLTISEEEVFVVWSCKTL